MPYTHTHTWFVWTCMQYTPSATTYLTPYHLSPCLPFVLLLDLPLPMPGPFHMENFLPFSFLFVSPPPPSLCLVQVLHPHHHLLPAPPHLFYSVLYLLPFSVYLPTFLPYVLPTTAFCRSTTTTCPTLSSWTYYTFTYLLLKSSIHTSIWFETFIQTLTF